MPPHTLRTSATTSRRFLVLIAAAVSLAWFAIMYLWLPDLFFPGWPAWITMSSGVLISLVALFISWTVFHRGPTGKLLAVSAALAAVLTGAGAGMWFVPDPGGLRMTDLFMVFGGTLIWVAVLTVSLVRLAGRRGSDHSSDLSPAKE